MDVTAGRAFVVTVEFTVMLPVLESKVFPDEFIPTYKDTAL
jgi:hypothetical protein